MRVGNIEAASGCRPGGFVRFRAKRTAVKLILSNRKRCCPRYPQSLAAAFSRQGPSAAGSAAQTKLPTARPIQDSAKMTVPATLVAGTILQRSRLPQLRQILDAGDGMSADQAAATRYRAYAAECFAISQQLEDVAARFSLVNIAQAWIALAEQAEEGSSEPYVKLN